MINRKLTNIFFTVLFFPVLALSNENCIGSVIIKGKPIIQKSAKEFEKYCNLGDIQRAFGDQQKAEHEPNDKLKFCTECIVFTKRTGYNKDYEY